MAAFAVSGQTGGFLDCCFVKVRSLILFIVSFATGVNFLYLGVWIHQATPSIPRDQTRIAQRFNAGVMTLRITSAGTVNKRFSTGPLRDLARFGYAPSVETRANLIIPTG